jgi:hypothetical protein
VPSDHHPNERTVHLLQALTFRHGVDIPPDALEQAGITADDYAEWRKVLADEEQHLRDVHTLAEIERREQEFERRRSLRGNSGWEADDD